MKAGVVPPDGGMRVDGENSGEGLREQKQAQGYKEEAFVDTKAPVKKGLEEPKGGDDDRKRIGELHFIELK